MVCPTIETGAARGYDSGIMPDPSNPNPISRRSLLTAGAAAFTIVQPQLVRGAGKEKLRAGLVGCGGRGTQATMDLLTGNENVELVAMADIFEDHLEGALRNLRDPKYLAHTSELQSRQYLVCRLLLE